VKKLVLFTKKEFKVLNEDDLEQIHRTIKDLYSSNLTDEILIVDEKEVRLSNIDLEFFNQAFKELNDVKYSLKKLNKDVFELKEIVSKLIDGIRNIQAKIFEEEIKKNK
jgi:uncharacterized protein YpuA (DUF1002 family)